LWAVFDRAIVDESKVPFVDSEGTYSRLINLLRDALAVLLRRVESTVSVARSITNSIQTRSGLMLDVSHDSTLHCGPRVLIVFRLIHSNLFELTE
jgi:hypothetical protein